jgi:hypothetical protein
MTHTVHAVALTHECLNKHTSNDPAGTSNKLPIPTEPAEFLEFELSSNPADFDAAITLS